MARYPRFMSYQPEELRQRMQQLCPEGTVLPTPFVVGSARITAHTFPVTFPDHRPGTCHYDRRAPRWHLFRYQYTDGIWMPYQSYNQPLPPDRTVLEQRGQEMAAACYAEAIQKERRDYFQRASEPSDGSRKRRPEKYQMKAAQARKYAGGYAVCDHIGERYFPVSPLYETIQRANEVWRQQGNVRLIVACGNRLDRCWELPRYNPLYAEYDPRDWLSAIEQSP